MITYVTYDELVKDSLELAKNLEGEYQAVLSIPRSGNIPASIIALHLNIPVISIANIDDAFKTNKFSKREVQNESGRFLVVDDSVHSGTRIKQAKEELKEFDELTFEYAAVYVRTDSAHNVDYHAKAIDGYRFFQWNLFNHAVLQGACLDIDGVVCHDPVISDRTNPEGYRNWVLNAKQLHPINKQTVKYFVTSRLEAYRGETEQWLKEHGYNHRGLIMSPHKTAQERYDSGSHGKDKAEFYKTSDCKLFIESSERQAKEIFAYTGKPVFCVDNNTLYQ